MDFERATIKALFYDYTIEKAVKVIRESENKWKDGYLDILPHFVRWRTDQYTTTEARLMGDLLEDEWLKTRCEENNRLPMVYRPLLLVRHVANQMLVGGQNDQKNLRVKFEDLLRWNDATLFVGEDLLTTAYIANKQAENPQNQNDLYLWPDMLPHNNRQVNDVLDEGVSDIHAHMNATADVFALNWISLMNSLSALSGLDIFCKQQYQDVTLTTTDTLTNYSLKQICIAAAWLRTLLFRKFVKGEKVDFSCWQEVYRILDDAFYAEHVKRQDLDGDIALLRRCGLCAENGEVIDYVIRPTPAVCANRQDIHLIFQGEREIMCSFLRAFYSEDKCGIRLAPYFYLYILLKTRVRKEFVQVNSLKGFENFEIYQDRKGIFVAEDSPIGKCYDQVAVQTTLSRCDEDKLEARITPWAIKGRCGNPWKGVFVKNAAEDEQNAKDRVSYVVHFIKANYTKAERKADLELSNRNFYPRYDKYRKEIKDQLTDVLDTIARQKKCNSKTPKLTGIDAASTEMFCRPEVFGQVFRYAGLKGVRRTYHVGEDFFDIPDGLRAIDEAILFLGLGSKDRVGHALAMGVDAEKYYTKRKFRLIIPAQAYLDNCVWLMMRSAQANIRMSTSLRTDLMTEAQQMYQQIGYQGVFNEYTYWNSMLLRGNDPWASLDDEGADKTGSLQTDWDRMQFVNDEQVRKARKDADARELYRKYNFCRKIKEAGEKRVEGKYRDKEEIVRVVGELQNWMQQELSRREIGVECNPSSNLKIGYFDEYKDHPLLTRFDPLDKQLPQGYPVVEATVNTDDRGVFHTSEYKELSLLALALRKQKENGKDKYNPREVTTYINRIRENGFKQRFK